jgi:hypothetical protein
LLVPAQKKVEALPPLLTVARLGPPVAPWETLSNPPTCTMAASAPHKPRRTLTVAEGSSSPVAPRCHTRAAVSTARCAARRVAPRGRGARSFRHRLAGLAEGQPGTQCCRWRAARRVVPPHSCWRGRGDARGSEHCNFLCRRSASACRPSGHPGGFCGADARLPGAAGRAGGSRCEGAPFQRGIQQTRGGHFECLRNVFEKRV